MTATSAQPAARWRSVGAPGGEPGGRRGTVRRALASLAHVVGLVAAGAVGLVVVVVPWLGQRVLFVDPLATAARSGWGTRRRASPDPARSRLGVTSDARLPRWYRLRRRLAVPLVVVGVVAAAVAVRPDPAPPAPHPAFADAPWWPDLDREIHWAFFSPGWAFNPLMFPPNHDVSGRYLNVVDGARVSWTAPPCTCERRTVWIYGGSTVFGLGQRDEHTIASYLARTAWEHGIALDVVNRGVLGDLHWEEAVRFGWDAASEDAADVAVFYDGYNDVQGVRWRNDRRSLDGFPIDWTAEVDRSGSDALRVLFRTFASEAPDGMELVDSPSAPLDPPAIAETVADRYERARHISSAIGRAHDIPVAWFWQPTSYTTGPDAGPIDPALDENSRIYRSVRRLLDRSVVDLADAFDEVDDPVLYDDVHTNEPGARLIAEEIFERIEPLLVAEDG